MSAEGKRKAERSLADAYHAIRRNKPVAEWIFSPEVRVFLDSWEELCEFYKVYDTFTEFNVEVIQVYLEFVALLKKKANSDLDLNTEEKVSEVLEEMEYWINELIKEAERNLYFIEDMDGEV